MDEITIRKAIARLNKETGHMSASHSIRRHPAWAELVGYGMPVVHVMLHDLQEGKRCWNYFGITCEIMGCGPVIPEDERGRLEPVTQRYIEWLELALQSEKSAQTSC